MKTRLLALTAFFCALIGCVIWIQAQDQKAGPSSDSAAPGIKALEDEWQRLNARIRDKTEEIQRLTTALQVHDLTPAGQQEQALENQRLEARIRHEEQQTLLKRLNTHPTEGLPPVLFAITRDPLLQALLDRKFQLQLQLASLPEEAPAHARSIETVTSQLGEVAASHLKAIEIQAAVHSAKERRLSEELAQRSRESGDRAIRQRPLHQAQRDLDSLKYLREQLTKRIIQLKLDTTIPRSSGVKPRSSRPWFRWLAWMRGSSTLGGKLLTKGLTPLIAAPSVHQTSGIPMSVK